jgi:hypothetical protein
VENLAPGYGMQNLSFAVSQTSNTASLAASDERARCPLQVYYSSASILPQRCSLAHQFALESENVVADMVEVTELPDLGNRYNVAGVPQTVVSEQAAAEGAMPEDHFLERALNGSRQHAQ